MTTLLRLSDLGKRYGPVEALHGVDLQVRAGTVHCVLGENGAGKSTLCNLVNGGVRPSSGSMTLKDRPYRPSSPAEALSSGVAMVHQHFSLIPTLTVQENLLLASGRFFGRRSARLGPRLERIRDEFGLSVALNARVADLPVGGRQKAEIVKALLTDPDLILLDEPTGVLDGAEIDALIGVCQAIAASGRGVVLVTHKLGEVSRVADEATVLRHGTVAGGGRLSEVAVAELLSLMLGQKPEDVSSVAAAAAGAGVTRRSVTRTAAEPVLSVRDLSVTAADGSKLVDGVQLDLLPGRITGIAGVEGNGQSELVRVLSGALRPTSGSVKLKTLDLTDAPPALRTAHGLGVVPEDRHHEGMVADLSVAENLFLSRLGDFRRYGLLDRKTLEAAAAQLIETYDVRVPGPRTPMKSLSGGNQQKVVLARELSIEGLQVLVAAQPTRGLDVGAVAAVLERLREAAGRGVAVLVVSSEVDELLTLCDQVLVSYRGRLLGPVEAGTPSAEAEIGALMTGTTA
ncbi:heme ABC transporter ATP-binding protein [Kineosporia sp. NBRC 101677]|uniref:ABC transporter ATP-binding protein n=1 Tax=Kineosporia sp. NBRC 101677 TaxID=3032197 RepID=UPI0024A4FC0E|nr:ABC transporter ATP-binding protein [Kineosporia sp. NBRC 101677]GLY13619.1 heme ABC transporter ATP-binding protein [Kineosporia sp. NBRC 101677]